MPTYLFNQSGQSKYCRMVNTKRSTPACWRLLWYHSIMGTWPLLDTNTLPCVLHNLVPCTFFLVILLFFEDHNYFVNLFILILKFLDRCQIQGKQNLVFVNLTLEEQLLTGKFVRVVDVFLTSWALPQPPHWLAADTIHLLLYCCRLSRILKWLCTLQWQDTDIKLDCWHNWSYYMSSFYDQCEQ